MTQQGDRQASLRAITGKALTYEGDWHALWDFVSVSAGTFDERMTAYVNLKLGTSYTNVNDAMQALATNQGAFNFSSMGTFTASVGVFITGTPPFATNGSAYSFTPNIGGGTGPYVVTLLSGALPTGTSIVANVVTGTVSATGTFTGVLRVTDALSNHADLPFSIISSNALVLTNAPATTANISSAYSYTPTTTGGRAPITWAITNKPSWPTFTPATGVLAGTTPGAPETDTGIIIVGTDADGRTVTTGSFQIAISASSPAAIDSFQIVNATSLDSANGVYLGTPYGYDLHGFGAEVVCNDIGLGSLPDASKFTLRIRNPGYKNGVAITRDTILTGRVIAPTQGTSTTFSYNYLYDTSVGGKRKFWVVFGYDPDATNALAVANPSLDVMRWVDQLHVGTTIVSATVAAGWYGASTAGAITGPVNNSTLPYLMPEVHPIDLERDYFGSGTTSKTVRFKVSHMYGQSGKMFDIATVNGKDAHSNSSATTTITDVSLASVTIPDPNTSPAVIVSTICAGTYTTSGLTAGDLCYDHIVVYPLIGTATEIYDSTNYEGDANIDDMRSPRRWKYDPSGTYGQMFAVVDPTQAGPGAASTVLATATLAANRFITWEAATAALKAANLASFGHPDTGAGVVYGYNTSGVDVVLAVGASLTTTQAPAGEVPVFYKQHPSNTANLIFDTSASAHTWPPMVIFDGCPVRKSGAGSLAPNTGSTDGKCVQVRNATIHLDIGNTGSNPWCGSNWSRILYENISFTASAGTPNVGQFGLGVNGSNPIYCKIAHGVLNSTAAQMPVVPYTALSLRGHIAPNEPGSGQPSNVGFIAHGLKMVKGAAGGTAQFAGNTHSYTGRGAHLEQFSYDATDINEDFGTGSDGTLQPLDNIVNSYGINPPMSNATATTRGLTPASDAATGRNNTAYNDVAGSQGIVKHVRERFIHDGRWAIKQSWFAYGTALAGRVANWKTWFMVGWIGNTMTFLRDPGVPPYTTFPQQGADNPYWAGAFQIPYGAYGVGVPAYTSNLQADLTLNEGTYQPTGGVGTAQWGRVPANHHTLKYDIKGVARLDDGTAMNGPYEHL